jgi:hypothetical protein
MAAAVLNLRPSLLRACGIVWAGTALAALGVWTIPGVHHATANWLLSDGPSPQGGPPPSLGEVLGLFWHNLAVCTVPLLLAAGGLGRGRLKRLVDVGIGLDVAAQAGIVGATIGAYGWRMVEFLPHLPFEWLGLAAGLAAWLEARDDHGEPLRRARLLSLAGHTSVLLISLVIAGFLETYATPHR